MAKVDASEIRTAIDMLDKTDAEQWADGKPVLAAVRRVAGNDALTQDEVDAALAPADGGTTLAPAAPAVARTAEPAPADASDPDNRPEGIGPSDDRTSIVLAQVEVLKESKKALMPELTSLAEQHAALGALLAAKEKEIIAIDAKVEEATKDISDADMVKRIQRQTQERLLEQAEKTKQVQAALNATGIKTFASELDRALSGGAKRSKVIMPGGKVFEAPHPRSPEGVKSYANWIHHGAQSPA